MGNNWRQWAFNVDKVKGSDRFVLVVIADICHDFGQGGGLNDTCQVRIKTIKRLTGLNDRTIQRALTKLEELGLVIGYAQARRNGSQSSNLYRLVKNPAGRQLSLTDTLTDPAGWERKDVEASGETTVDKMADEPPPRTKCPDPPGNLTPHTGQNVTPLTTPLTTIGQKEEASAVRPLVSLDDFLKGYDEKGQGQPNAIAKAWKRLTWADRIAAVRSLPVYGAVLQANTWRQVKAGHLYLSQKMFMDFQPRPETAQTAAAGGFRVEVGSAQWDAWVAYETKPDGRPPFFVAWCRDKDRTHWQMASEWPPEREKENG